MKIKWVRYNPRGVLPRERKVVLLQIEVTEGFSVGAVACGYLRRGSGGPFWVIPSVGGTVTHWADIFEHDFECPGWPGTHEGAATRDDLQGRKRMPA